MLFMQSWGKLQKYLDIIYINEYVCSKNFSGQAKIFKEYYPKIIIYFIFYSTYLSGP